VDLGFMITSGDASCGDYGRSNKGDYNNEFYHLKWPAFVLMLINLFDYRCPKKSFCLQELIMGSKFNYYQTKVAIGTFGE
jgi:hypothetical protein